MQSPKEETKLWRHSELEWCTNICDILSLKGKESLSIIHGHSKFTETENLITQVFTMFQCMNVK